MYPIYYEMFVCASCRKKITLVRKITVQTYHQQQQTTPYNNILEKFMNSKERNEEKKKTGGKTIQFRCVYMNERHFPCYLMFLSFFSHCR